MSDTPVFGFPLIDIRTWPEAKDNIYNTFVREVESVLQGVQPAITIQNTDGYLVVTNGDGVGGDPTINWDTSRTSYELGSDADANVILELGPDNPTADRLVGIDFHTNSVPSDYDSRILASGGSGASGDGTLQLVAATVSVVGGAFSGNGSGLTTLNASNISFGTLPEDRISYSGPTVPTLVNGYTNAGGTRYWKVGRVGFIAIDVARATTPAAGTTIFTLPSGFRPDVSCRMCANFGQTTPLSIGIARVTINTGGAVVGDYAVGATPGSSGFNMQGMACFPCP